MAAVRAVPPDNAGTMLKNTATKSIRRSLPALAQIVQLIPPGMVESLAEGSRVKARRFSYENQVFSLMLGQLCGAFSLNEICDAEEVHRKKLLRIRGMLPARRNTFSNANRTRDPAVAKALFWRMRERLERLSPPFMHPRPKRWLARFRHRRLYAVDATVLPLTLKSIDWARHRRQKAAAKLHMRCDLASRLPAFACVTGVQVADCREMERLCKNLGVGDVAIFDRAYNDSAALWRLDARGVFLVVREKKRARYRTERSAPERGRPPNVLSDEVIFLSDPKTRKKYPGPLRCIRARVEVDGKMREMVFLTNNLEWSAATIAELYRARWQVELLFKESSKRCSCGTSTARTPTPWLGKFGRRCWCTCYCVSWRFARSGTAATRAARGWSRRRFGSGWTSWSCSRSMGQHHPIREWMERKNPVFSGVRALLRAFHGTAAGLKREILSLRENTHILF